jgi:AcrR family transcriptional regulator
MGTIERRERERSETRDKILAAARELFAREGYEAVSMRKIAEAIEYSPTAIYVHFKDKRALMDELCRVDFGAMAQDFQHARGVSDPIQRLRVLGEGYVQFAVQRPNHFRLMFLTPGVHPEQLSPEDIAQQGDPSQDGYAVLQTTVREGVAQRRFRPEFEDDVELISQTFWAGVHGVASIQVVKHDDPWLELAPLERRVKVMIDALIRGMTVDAVASNGSKRKGARS